MVAQSSMARSNCRPAARASLSSGSTNAFDLRLKFRLQRAKLVIVDEAVNVGSGEALEALFRLLLGSRALHAFVEVSDQRQDAFLPRRRQRKATDDGIHRYIRDARTVPPRALCSGPSGSKRRRCPRHGARRR
jgi:hypothetical protein